MKLALGLLGLVIIFCGTKEFRAQPISTSETTLKKVAALPKSEFIYRSEGRRDPFKPLVSEKPVSEKPVSKTPTPKLRPGEIDIHSLRLSGLIWDDKGEAMALLYGEGAEYILKRGRLFKENYKPVKNVFGEIKGEVVYLIQGKTKMRLTLKKEEK